MNLIRFALSLIACLSPMRLASSDETATAYRQARNQMVRHHLTTAGIDAPNVLTTMRQTPREEFVPADQRRFAYFDMALPIGHGQTISPPYIVAFMTQQLQLESTDKVLEIGTGSGYQAAVLSPLVEEVYTIEIVKPLGESAAKTLRRLGYENVHTRVGDGFKGWPEQAPFDKIIVTCSPENVPQPLVDQLAEGGRLVIPVGERFQQTLMLFLKRNGQLKRQALQSTFFVPMTGRAEEKRGETEDGSLHLTNGNFDQVLDSGHPIGWYYLRQAKAVPHEKAEGRYLSLTNSTTGRAAQALQAIGVDGIFSPGFRLALRVAGKQISQPDESMAAQAAVHFYDDNRSPCGSRTFGLWSGTFGWKDFEAEVSIPARAKLAVVAVGLFGTTGELMIDDVIIKELPGP